MKLILLTLLGLIGLAGSAHAACNIPNPNLNAPPFVDNCPLPAATLNRLLHNPNPVLASQFGVVADWNGSSGTDNTLAVASAVAYCNANPGVAIQFPPGTMVLTSLSAPYVITGGCQFMGTQTPGNAMFATPNPTKSSAFLVPVPYSGDVFQDQGCVGSMFQHLTMFATSARPGGAYINYQGCNQTSGSGYSASPLTVNNTFSNGYDDIVYTYASNEIEFGNKHLGFADCGTVFDNVTAGFDYGSWNIEANEYQANTFGSALASICHYSGSGGVVHGTTFNGGPKYEYMAKIVSPHTEEISIDGNVLNQWTQAAIRLSQADKTTGNTHTSTTIDNIPVDVRTLHWKVGATITDVTHADIPANTTITAMTGSSITLSQAAVGTHTGDTLSIVSALAETHIVNNRFSEQSFGGTTPPNPSEGAIHVVAGNGPPFNVKWLNETTIANNTFNDCWNNSNGGPAEIWLQDGDGYIISNNQGQMNANFFGSPCSPTNSANVHLLQVESPATRVQITDAKWYNTLASMFGTMSGGYTYSSAQAEDTNPSTAFSNPVMVGQVPGTALPNNCSGSMFHAAAGDNLCLNAHADLTNGISLRAVTDDGNTSLQGMELFASKFLFQTGPLQANSGIVPATSLVSGLPTCNSTTLNQVREVSDANSPTYAGIVAGSGSTFALVLCDGTNWRAH